MEMPRLFLQDTYCILYCCNYNKKKENLTNDILKIPRSNPNPKPAKANRNVLIYMKRNYTRKNSIILLILAVIILAAILAGTAAFGKQYGEAAAPEEISEGVAFLQQQEALNVEEIDRVMADRRKQELIAEYDENIRRLEDESTDVWSLFHDYVLLGDSRAVTFSFAGMLAEDRVFADTGNLIWDAEYSMDSVASLNPAYIFFCYGLNDIVAGIWTTYEDYVSDYEEMLRGVRERLPGATIFVNSILLVREPTRSELYSWEAIPEVNDLLREMCEWNGFIYIDNDQICEEHWDLYQEDDKHMEPEFYPYWGRNMMRAVYDSAFADVMGEENAEEYTDESYTDEGYTDEGYTDEYYGEEGYGVETY